MEAGDPAQYKIAWVDFIIRQGWSQRLWAR
jgi:hypothetical protein